MIQIQLFTPGKTVSYNGRMYNILYNSIRGSDLFVYLDGQERPIHTRDLWVEPTMLELKRKTE